MKRIFIAFALLAAAPVRADVPKEAPRAASKLARGQADARLFAAEKDPPSPSMEKAQVMRPASKQK